VLELSEAIAHLPKGPSGNKLTREGAINDTRGYEDDIQSRKVRPDAQEPE